MTPDARRQDGTEDPAIAATAGQMTPAQALRDALERTRRQWRSSRTCQALARAAFGAAAVLACGLLASWLLPGDGLPDAVLWMVTTAAAIVFATIQVWPLHRRPSIGQVARLFEERCPELEDRLVAAAETIDRHGTSPFAALVVADAASRVRDVPPERVFDPRAVRRGWIAAIAGAFALVAVTAGVMSPLGRTMGLIRAMAFPAAFEIEVSPGDARVVAGEGLTIVAQVRGAERLPDRAPSLRLTGPEGEEQTVAMVPAAAPAGAGRYQHTVSAVQADFTYRVTVAASATRDFAVQVLTGPRVERIDAYYTYPAFTGLAPRAERDSGDIYAPAGTRVRLEVRTDKPVTTGRLAMAEGQDLALTAGPDGVLAGKLLVEHDGAYRVALTDADGLHNPGDTEYFIRTMEDRPPDVRVMRPAGDRKATELEEVPIEARADDDYGVQSLELVYSVSGRAERVVPLAQPKGATSVEGRTTVYLEDLKVEPGDFVSYYARARDVARGKRSSESRSDLFFVEIEPFGGEFQAAQSQATGGAGGNRTSLAAAQKEIVVATWKLERRAAGGRSAKDVETVATAQQELRVRAMQAARMAGGARPRRFGQPPPDPGASPLARAVDAMARAEAALATLQTGAAIPHEMEAYTQLLKANAEQQRFQVARNRGAGAGGAGREAPDLSTLFDRELQRQQETNYETRSSLEERQETPESDALSKVRELARRQEEINRQQRDLARQSVGAEELKRQLERLTREQADLRQRAEALSREMARSGAEPKGTPEAPGQSARTKSEGAQQGAPGARQGDALREAADAMGSASGDLRRQNPSGANASGERALDRLRDAERQLQRAQPGSQAKALGNLQVEAQQVAEAQRKLAADAERADLGPTGHDDRRRLAGEKDRLADRVQQLENAMKDLAARSDDEAKARLADAARALGKHQVAHHLRASASALRREARGEEPAGGSESAAKGKPGGESTSPRPSDDAAREKRAATDQALTRALDDVAERLAATGDSATAQSLSDQIARTRQAQDRLSALERQIDALAKKGGDAPESKSGAGEDRPGAAATTRPAAGQQGSDGRRGQGGEAAGELARLRREYARELQQSEDVMRQLQRQSPGLGTTPERQEMVVSAPGTEAFKQDFARWDDLRREVKLAIDQVQASLSARLSDQRARDRVNAGGDGRVPEEYRTLIAKYYQSLATVKKP